MNVNQGILKSSVLNLWSYLRAYKAPGHLGLNRRATGHEQRATNLLYNCRARTTNRIFFLQNEPNFQKSQMDVSDLLIREYGLMDTWFLGKNKAKTNPIKAKTNPITDNISQKMPKQTKKADFECKNTKKDQKDSKIEIFEKFKYFENILAL